MSLPKPRPNRKNIKSLLSLSNLLLSSAPQNYNPSSICCNYAPNPLSIPNRAAAAAIYYSTHSDFASAPLSRSQKYAKRASMAKSLPTSRKSNSPSSTTPSYIRKNTPKFLKQNSQAARPSIHHSQQQADNSIFLGTPANIRFLAPHVLELHEQIKIHAIRGNILQVMELYQKLEREPTYDPQNDFIISMLVLTHIQAGKPASAIQVFQQFYTLPGMNFNRGKNRVFLTMPLNILMQAYGELKDITSVLKVFKCIEEEGLHPDVNSCTAVIRAFLNCGQFEHALKIVREWVSSSLFPETLDDTRRVAINDVIYRDLALSLFKSVISPQQQRENMDMILEAAKKDLNENTYRKVCNSILKLYSDQGKDDELERLFSQLFFSTLSEETRKNDLHPNQNTLHILVSHFAHKRDIERLRRYLNLHLNDFPDIRPSKAYAKVVMNALGATRNYDLLHAVFSEFFTVRSTEHDEDDDDFHSGEGEMSISRLEATAEEYNLIIRALASNGEVDRMKNTVKDMKRRGIQLTPATHVYIMLGHIMAHNSSKFLKLFQKRMASPHSPDFIHPDVESFVFLLSKIAASGQLQLLNPVMETMQKFGIKLDSSVHNRILRGLGEVSKEKSLNYFVAKYQQSLLSEFGSDEDDFSFGTTGQELATPDSMSYIQLSFPFAMDGDHQMCQKIISAYVRDGYVHQSPNDRSFIYNRLIASLLVAQEYEQAYFSWMDLFELDSENLLLPESDPVQQNYQGTPSIVGQGGTESQDENFAQAFGLSTPEPAPRKESNGDSLPKAIPNATSFSYLQFIYKALNKTSQEELVELYRREHSLNKIPKDDFALFKRFTGIAERSARRM